MMISNAAGMPFICTLVEQRRRARYGGSGYILGMPGAGVSLASKEQIMSILQSDSDERVIVVDINGQYVPLVKHLGGQVIPIGSTAKLESQAYINVFDINMRSSIDCSPDAIKVDFITAWQEIILGGHSSLSEQQKSIISRCVKKVYEPYINSLDINTCQYDESLLPTVLDFQKALRLQEGFDAWLMAESLEVFISGSQNMFSKPTNIVHDDKFVVYDLSACCPSNSPLHAMAVLEHIWTHYISVDVCRGAGKTLWLFIDDLYPLLKSNASAEYLRWLYMGAQPRGCIVTAVTRDVETFLDADLRYKFLSRSDYIHLLPMGALASKHLTERMSLPVQQAQFLKNARVGQALICQFESFAEVRGFDDVKIHCCHSAEQT